MSEKKDPSSRKLKDNVQQYNRYIGVGIQIAAPVIGGFLLGDFLDRYFKFKTPWLTLTLSMAMIIVALYQLIKQSSKK